MKRQLDDRLTDIEMLNNERGGNYAKKNHPLLMLKDGWIILDYK